jgi:uncharacterized protein
MLSFDIRGLESRAAQVDGRLTADDDVWVDGDPLPADAILVTGRLSGAGAGRFYFSGHLEGTVDGTCRRCLTDTTAAVADDVHLIFAEAGDMTAAEDPDVYELEPGAAELDLRPAIREEWLLSAPAFLQCREDCKGLCPSCGIDLNVETCECAQPTTDSRWDALRKLRDQLP